MPGYYLSWEYRKEKTIKVKNADERPVVNRVAVTTQGSTWHLTAHKRSGISNNSVRKGIFNTSEFKNNVLGKKLIGLPLKFHHFVPHIKNALSFSKRYETGDIKDEHNNEKVLPKIVKTAFILGIVVAIVFLGAFILGSIYYSYYAISGIIFLIDTAIELVAMIVSIKALIKTTKNRNQYNGMGLAITSFVISLIFALLLASIWFPLWFPFVL